MQTEGELYRSGDLLVRARIGRPSPFCVVTFHSYTDHRTLDREGFGERFFASRDVNAIHVLSRDNDWFLLPDIEAALAAAAQAAAPCDRILSYGSSMGGYAAIRMGALAGATTAIALSPQFSLDPEVASFETRWANDARRLDFAVERRLGRKGFVESAFVFYDPNDLADARHVELFRPWVAVHDVQLPDSGHPVAGFLAEVRLLERAALEPARGAFDPEAFARDALARRDGAPQHHLTLASRAGGPRKALEHLRRAHELVPSDVGYLARYAQALAAVGRHAEAEAKLDEAMAAAPEHLFVLHAVSDYFDAGHHHLDLRRHRRSARATIDWLARLHPGVAPIVAVRDWLNRPRGSDVLERLRDLPETLRAGGAPVRSSLSPPLERVAATPGAPAARAPASPPTIRSWRRHAATTAVVRRHPVDVALVGDALAELWPARTWGRRKVLNLGSSGDRIQHLLWRLACLDDDAIDARAAVVTIGMGNLLAGDRLADIVGGVGDVARALRRVAPTARIAMVALPPLGPGFRFRDDDRQAFNVALASLPGVERVSEPADWSPSGPDAGCYRPDGVHLTPLGYRRLSDAVAWTLASPPRAPADAG